MISFRQTTKGDIPALSEILSATSCHFDVALNGLNQPVSGWVACNDGMPVGFALANRKDSQLLVVAVDPEFTGKGIARELMRQAEAWLFSHGWSEINLSMPVNGHEHIVGFFQRLGWSPAQSEGDRFRLKKANPQSPIKLEEHVIDDPDTGYSRLIRLQRGPADKSHRLCLFLDGESYWRDMNAIPLFNELLKSAKLPPMTIALIGHVSVAARHDDYTCNESYARFVGAKVMPWLRKEVSLLDSGGHIICGLSLSGLTAVYLTLLYPQHFRGCLSQSGSHWWRHEWFTAMALSKSPVNARFWLSVGDQESEVNVKHPPTDLLQEISQIEGVETAARVLKGIGGVVRHEQYKGGHSLQCWRDELNDALSWLATEDPPNKRIQPTANAAADP